MKLLALNRITLISLIIAVPLLMPWAIKNGQQLTAGVYTSYRRHLVDPRTIREYLQTNPVRKLHLGAGSNNIPGWLNSDIEPEGNAIYLDVTQPFPFESETIHYIFAEHLIEHIPWEGGLNMLKESFRVLAPGGKFRIFVPDLARHVYALENPDKPDVIAYLDANRRLFGWRETPVPAAYDFNINMREWGHRFMYDGRTLRKTFELAGFKKIKQLSIDDKTDPEFEKVAYRTQEHGRWTNDVWLANRFISMIFEVQK